MTGTKYYEHNEEINYSADKIVRVYDENDGVIGDMKYGEAYAAAMSVKKDIVLRNPKSDPPICKIMNYKLELMKRLFRKLGRDVTPGGGKTKSIRLTTTISVHDLENKKRKAIEYLKTVAGLKIYMKVNIYEPDNVQKGRLMLLNLAEDMKEYCKVTVAPAGSEKKDESSKGKKEDKNKTIQQVQDMSQKQAFVKLDGQTIDEESEDDEDRASYLFMEL